MGMDICLLANEIDGIFTLPCALCADHSILPEVIHTLAAVDRMVICGSQGIGDVLLVSDAVPAVLWLAVYGISVMQITGSCSTSGTLLPPVP